MYGVSAIRAELRISIQARNAQDLVAGHLATGVLADSDLVMVPNPQLLVIDEAPDVQALVIPVPVSHEKTIERFDVQYALSMSLRSDPKTPIVLFLKLRQHSIYAPQVKQCRDRALGRELEKNGGNMWAAMETVGMIPTGLREGPSKAELRAAAEAENDQNNAVRALRLFDSREELGVATCWIPVFCCGHGDE
jgi:hypothetical protein